MAAPIVQPVCKRIPMTHKEWADLSEKDFVKKSKELTDYAVKYLEDHPHLEMAEAGPLKGFVNYNFWEEVLSIKFYVREKEWFTVSADGEPARCAPPKEKWDVER